MTFSRAIPLILRFEGGRVDDPDDRGGRTAYGITQATYDRWLRAKGRPPADVWDIRPEDVQAIYQADYWRAAHCDRLAWPASLVVFDAAVNHGVGRAIRQMQEALNVSVDGVVGPITLMAMEGADPEALTESILWIRMRLYLDLSGRPNQLKFLRGWLSRLMHVRQEAGLA